MDTTINIQNDNQPNNTMRSTPTCEHVRFFEITQKRSYAQGW